MLEDSFMNSMYATSSFLPLKPSSHLLTSFQPLPSLCNLGYHRYSQIYHQSSHSIHLPLISINSLHAPQSSISATIPSNEGTDSVVQFEDFLEKDWSFLDTDNTNSDEECRQKIDRIISAGDILETSKVLVSIGSQVFVDRVVDKSPCEQLLIVHDSLLVLACIKEKYDKVKCWHGELLNIPEKWTPFDVVFLYFLPGLPLELDEVLGGLAKHCLSGARLVISLPQGRQVVEEQRLKYPDVVVSNLPEKMMLQNIAANHSFELVEFVDESDFYLAVLRLIAKCDVQTDR